MEVGSFYPLGERDEISDLCESIVAFKVIAMRQHGIVKTKAEHCCCKCFKPIPKKKKCLFSNIILKHPDHCPTIFTRFWWHFECDDMPYEKLVENAKIAYHFYDRFE